MSEEPPQAVIDALNKHFEAIGVRTKVPSVLAYEVWNIVAPARRPSPPVVDGELPQWNDLPEPTRVALCNEAEFYAPHIGGDAALGIYNKLRELLASQPQSPRSEGDK